MTSLSHYSSAPIGEAIRSVKQVGEPHFKPKGFWVSVDGEDDWAAWCRGGEFNLAGLAVRHRVVLQPEARVLTISDADALRDFTARYKVDVLPGLRSSMFIDWREVARFYQGIIIAPYQWECRLAQDVSWYYAWDCASGCIWDATAIQAVTVMEEPAHAR